MESSTNYSNDFNSQDLNAMLQELASDKRMYKNEDIIDPADVDETIQRLTEYRNRLITSYDGPSEYNFSPSYNHITNINIKDPEDTYTYDGVIVSLQGIFIIELIKEDGVSMIDSWGNLKHFEGGWKGYKNIVDVLEAKRILLEDELRKRHAEVDTVTPIIVTIPEHSTLHNEHIKLHCTTLPELKNYINTFESKNWMSPEEILSVSRALFNIKYKADVMSIPKAIKALRNANEIRGIVGGNNG